MPLIKSWFWGNTASDGNLALRKHCLRSCNWGRWDYRVVGDLESLGCRKQDSNSVKSGWVSLEFAVPKYCLARRKKRGKAGGGGRWRRNGWGVLTYFYKITFSFSPPAHHPHPSKCWPNPLDSVDFLGFNDLQFFTMAGPRHRIDTARVYFSRGGGTGKTVLYFVCCLQCEVCILVSASTSCDRF